jgi:GT2 family glycosyltransferase
VIPTLGRISQLRDCLGALARLDYPAGDFEVVVVNDGGGSAVGEVVAGWSDRLGVELVSTAGVGAAAARNAGVGHARGHFVAFTDDDCAPEAGWLSALEPVLEGEAGAGVGGRVVNGAPGRCAAGSQAVLDATHSHFNRDPGGPTFFATSNLAFPTKALREIGGFDEQFKFAEDRELCERWRRSGRRLGYAPGAVVRHMRELSPHGVWRQHFGYGQGAWDYHRVREERGWGQFGIEPGFYRELARQVGRRRDGAGPLSVAAIAVIAQAANAAGFAWEAASVRWRARRPGPSP